MKVLYYTSTNMLDLSVEIIKILKQHVDLHVLIEISPGQKTSGITNVEHLPEETLVKPSEILNEKDYAKIKSYFNGLTNVYFVVHRKKELISSFKTSYKMWGYIKKIRPDVIHVELATMRSVSIIPAFIYTKKICIGIHDPVPHLGEKDWRIKIFQFLFDYFPISKEYFFYSKFSKCLFEEYYKKNKHKKLVLQMRPYSFLKNLESQHVKERKHILFFGRMSPYKGIDILLKAMPLVLQKFPNETLIIAGQSRDGFSLDEEIANECRGNVTIINRYIPNEELYEMIMSAKFIVCPYKDATQSGVLMTAFALNTPVIATRVGAFPEFIEENVTSLLTPANDYVKLSEKIVFALENEFYKQMASHLAQRNEIENWDLNKNVILNAYHN